MSELRRRIPETCRDVVTEAVAAERAACAAIAREVQREFVHYGTGPLEDYAGLLANVAQNIADAIEARGDQP